MLLTVMFLHAARRNRCLGLSRVECTAGRAGGRRGAEQHINYGSSVTSAKCSTFLLSFSPFLPSLLPSFLSIPLSRFVRSFVLTVKSIPDFSSPPPLAQRLFPRGAPAFSLTLATWMGERQGGPGATLWPILVHCSLFHFGAVAGLHIGQHAINSPTGARPFRRTVQTDHCPHQRRQRSTILHYFLKPLRSLHSFVERGLVAFQFQFDGPNPILQSQLNWTAPGNRRRRTSCARACKKGTLLLLVAATSLSLSLRLSGSTQLHITIAAPSEYKWA